MCNNNRIIIVALMFVCAFSCTKEAQTDIVNDTVNEPVYVEGLMTVKFNDEVADSLFCGNAQLAADFARMGVLSYERVFPYDEQWEERHREAGLHRYYYVKYDENQLPVTKAADSFLSLPGAENAELVPKVKRFSNEDAFFNDPMLYRQWHYINQGLAGNYVDGADINVLPVWETYTCGSNEVIVGVVDGGVDMSHEDIGSVVIPASDHGSYNFVDGNTNVTGEEHGTHVAGTIAAINNNGKGVCGIAGGNDGTGGVRVLSCQVGKEGDEHLQNTSRAIVHAADNGAVICQNSWGYTFKSESEALSSNILDVDKAAIDYFIKNAGVGKNGEQIGPMKGGVVIFAAGNDSFRMGWPAAYEPVIAVGSMNSLGGRSYYSNYGSWVDICAPGGDTNVGPCILSTVLNNKYKTLQGTSMACPHVSGVAALLVSYYGQEGFTNEMLRERLLGGANAEKVPSYLQIGPLVDAYGSFRYGRNLAPEQVSSYTVNGRGGSVEFKWNTTPDPEGSVAYGYMLLASENPDDFSDIDFNKLPSSVHFSKISTIKKTVGEEVTAFLRGLEYQTQYYVAIVGYDYGRSFSEISEVKTVTTTENSEPVVEALFESPLSVSATLQLSAQLRIFDPDGDDVNVVFNPDSRLTTATLSKNADDPELWDFNVNALMEKSGNYPISVSVSDKAASTCKFDFILTIRENHTPILKKEFEDLVFEKIGESREFNPSDYFYDEDSDRLTYSVSHSNSKIAHLFFLDNSLSVTSLGYGVDEILVTATDPKGLSVSTNFKVLVREADAPADIYPTQVKDVLKIAGGEEEQAEVSIFNASGQIVYKEILTTSAFHPAEIDLSAFAPGIYTVNVLIKNNLTSRTIVKL